MTNHRSRLPMKIMDIHNSRTTINDVNGILADSNAPSSGTVVHEQQVTPDRHQATACNITKEHLKIG